MQDAPDLNKRRRRAIFRAQHRGMKEMDIILGGYAQSEAMMMDGIDLDTFEQLLEVLDRDLFKWFMGEAPVAEAFDTPLFRAICTFHGIEPRSHG